jgi:hypothetical protein
MYQHNFDQENKFPYMESVAGSFESIRLVLSATITPKWSLKCIGRKKFIFLENVGVKYKSSWTE